MKLKALKNHKVYGHAVKVGEVYEVSDRDGRMLTRTRLSEAAPDDAEVVYSRNTYSRRDMRAAPVSGIARADLRTSPALATAPHPPTTGKEEIAVGAGKASGGAVETAKDLASHTKAELLEIAKAENIPVLSHDSKADLVHKIAAARKSK